MPPQLRLSLAPTVLVLAIYFLAGMPAIKNHYFLVSKIMGRAVEVPAVITMLATLIGGALLGIIGALIAIPVAAAIRLLLNETAFPRLDRS